jgi:hypothetical protein
LTGKPEVICCNPAISLIAPFSAVFLNDYHDLSPTIGNLGRSHVQQKSSPESRQTIEQHAERETKEGLTSSFCVLVAYRNAGTGQCSHRKVATVVRAINNSFNNLLGYPAKNK